MTQCVDYILIFTYLIHCQYIFCIQIAWCQNTVVVFTLNFRLIGTALYFPSLNYIYNVLRSVMRHLNIADICQYACFKRKSLWCQVLEGIFLYRPIHLFLKIVTIPFNPYMIRFCVIIYRLYHEQNELFLYCYILDQIPFWMLSKWSPSFIWYFDIF